MERTVMHYRTHQLRKIFFEKIKFCVETGVLEELSHKSVLLYKNKLNWNHWGNEVRNLFNSILNKS